MITYEMIKQAQEQIISAWGIDKGSEIIALCHKQTRFNGNSKHFLGYCTACGGDWGQMLLTGIQKLYPMVYEAIPDKMGLYPFTTLCATLLLCGVDTSE